jgi:ribosomal protein S1
VVRPGQQVRVRVLEVDRARNRISLSMRPADSRAPRAVGASGRARSAALRELDKLFKK